MKRVMLIMALLVGVLTASSQCDVTLSQWEVEQLEQRGSIEHDGVTITRGLNGELIIEQSNNNGMTSEEAIKSMEASITKRAEEMGQLTPKERNNMFSGSAVVRTSNTVVNIVSQAEMDSIRAAKARVKHLSADDILRSHDARELAEKESEQRMLVGKIIVGVLIVIMVIAIINGQRNELK